MTSQHTQNYRKKGTTPMRPYTPGEDLTGVSVEPGYSPKAGDMVAHDRSDVNSRWLVSREYFEQNYELVE